MWSLPHQTVRADPQIYTDQIRNKPQIMGTGLVTRIDLSPRGVRI